MKNFFQKNINSKKSSKKFTKWKKNKFFWPPKKIFKMEKTIQSNDNENKNNVDERRRELE